MPDTVPAMLEPGEYVIRKDAAEEIGIDNLNMLNNIDRSSQMYMNHGGLVPQLQHGHSAIDELLAINTLSNQANVDMTRQTGMFNQGGQVESPQDPDPLQIDARMRREFSDIGTIGMVDSSASLGQMLDKIQQDNAMRKHLERRYGDKPETLRAHLEIRKDDFMPQEEIMRWLNYAAKQTQSKPDTIRGYQDGGSVGGTTYTYGSQTTTDPTLASIFEMAGVQPTEEQMDKFKEYDFAREEGALADYSRGVEGLRMQGTGALGQATQQAQTMGGGFAGFGGRQAAMDTTRRQAEYGYQTGLDQAAQDRFETIRSMREGYQADILNQLSTLEELEGTQDVGSENLSAPPSVENAEGWSPPAGATQGTSYSFNGQNYYFLNGKWAGQNEWDAYVKEEMEQGQAASEQSDRDDFSSDINLKDNINFIGKSDSGVNIYTFTYKDSQYGDGVYKGVMAQEVPWASKLMNNGYLAVDYSKVDVDFEKIG